MKKIIVLMPSARPNIAVDVLDHWTKMAKQDFESYLILNENYNSKYNTVVVQSNRYGVVDSLYKFTKNFNPDPNSIIILAMDDLFANEGWDDFVRSQFENFDGLLVTFDGHQPNNVATVPILSSEFFIDLGKAILHPSYFHLHSDVELYYNALDMKRLKDIRPFNKTVWFEHRHYCSGHRIKDKVDQLSNCTQHLDQSNYMARHKLPIEERLKINEI